jgi:hypothetical protein
MAGGLEDSRVPSVSVPRCVDRADHNWTYLRTDYPGGVETVTSLCSRCGNVVKRAVNT